MMKQVPGFSLDGICLLQDTFPSHRHIVLSAHKNLSLQEPYVNTDNKLYKKNCVLPFDSNKQLGKKIISNENILSNAHKFCKGID